MSLIEFQEEIEATSNDENGLNIKVAIVDCNGTRLGGGLYINNQKQGQWIEIEMNQKNCQIKFDGKYFKGKRYGEWKFYHNNELFGTKQYDENGNEIRNSFSYQVFYHPVQSQVLTQKYQLYKGKKIGQYYTFFKYEFLETGNYDINENKFGFWKETIANSLRIDAQTYYDEINSTIDVVYTEGNYENGKRQGSWESRAYQNTGSYIKDSIRTVAIGNYDQGLRTGIWEEPYSYYDEYSLKETVKGNYVNDRRHGKWEFISKISPKQWGGEYDNGMKTGIWDEFQRFGEYKSTSTFDILIQERGNYYNNYRVGAWSQKADILSEIEDQSFLNYDNGQLHGEQQILSCIGKYKCYLIKEKGHCENGQKINEWTCQLFHSVINSWVDYTIGSYDNGKKVGQWIEYQNFDVYDSEGISTVGLRNRTLFIQWTGNYYNGYREGRWTWKFVKLLAENYEDDDHDDDSIYQIEGFVIYTNESYFQTGIFPLFETQFGERQARFKFFDVFEGNIVNGLRDGKWNFVYAAQIIQNDSSQSNDSNSESNQSDQKKDNNNSQSEPVVSLIVEPSPYETYNHGKIIKSQIVN